MPLNRSLHSLPTTMSRSTSTVTNKMQLERLIPSHKRIIQHPDILTHKATEHFIHRLIRCIIRHHQVLRNPSAIHLLISQAILVVMEEIGITSRQGKFHNMDLSSLGIKPEIIITFNKPKEETIIIIRKTESIGKTTIEEVIIEEAISVAISIEEEAAKEVIKDGKTIIMGDLITEEAIQALELHRIDKKMKAFLSRKMSYKHHQNSSRKSFLPPLSCP